MVSCCKCLPTMLRRSYSTASSMAPHQAPLEWWYPGHMVKGMRQMQKVLKTVDCVVEVHDARIPFTGRNPMLRDRLSAIKPLVVAFNKADLVPQEVLTKVRARLDAEGVKEVVFTGADSPEKDASKLVQIVKRLVRSGARYQRRDAPDFNAMVVGVPNVGKSTVINRLRRIGVGSGHKKGGGARVGAIAGVTRSIAKMKISEDPLIYVFDTPGILEPSVKDRDAAFKLALCSALPDERLGQMETAAFLLSWLESIPNFDVSTLPQLLGHNRSDSPPPDVDFEAFKRACSRPIESLCCDHAAVRGWTRSFKSPASGKLATIPDMQRAAGDILKMFRRGELGKFCLDEID